VRITAAVLVVTGIFGPAFCKAQSTPQPGPAAAQPQSSSALRFEVASVRPTITQTEFTQQMIAAQRAGRGGSYTLGRITGTHYDTDGMTMKALIAGAFQIDARLIVGSDWVNEGEARFAIHAVMPEGATSKAQFCEMMIGLLEERFHLVTHRATVGQPAYALVTARTGPKLKKSRDLDQSACDEWRDSTPAGNQVCNKRETAGDHNFSIMMMTNSVYGPTVTTSSSETGRHEEFLQATMPLLARFLTAQLSVGGALASDAGSLVSVVDQTGIQGEWDVELDRTFGDTDTALSSYMTSLKMQGLLLEKTTEPVEKLFIDHVDKVPTEN
jgi:uncharacterized protein (TIGR03435 family)